MGGQDAEFIDWALRRVGTMVKDKYFVEKLLGVGGMASVYAATHRNGKRVALKVLHPSLSIRGDIKTRFRREGQVANAVKHPGAVEVIDDDIDDDGSAFLVMELLEGRVVEELWELHGRRLSAIVVLAMAREVCEVLAAAHRAGVVHRDLKPENLFLTNDGQLKVLDFGLAHLGDMTKPKDTHTGMVFGTPAFMAPEQASGRTSQIDERSDIWSVGATMFTLLSGGIVHEGESSQHITMLSATIQARSLAAVLPDVHPALANVVDRALTWDKDTRWPSAMAMRDAICATCHSIFGEERPELPTAYELAASSAAAPLPDSSPTTEQALAKAVEEEETTRTDQVISQLGAIEEPETETTEVRGRPGATQESTGWSALRDVLESGHTEPITIGEPPDQTPPIEDMTRLNVTKVRQPQPNFADRTSVIAIDLRPSQSRQLVSNSYIPVAAPGGGGLQSYGSIPPAMKPRPPSLNPRRDSPTEHIIVRSRVSYLPWVLASVAITVAAVAVWFAVADRRANAVDPLASAFHAPPHAATPDAGP